MMDDTERVHRILSQLNQRKITTAKAVALIMESVELRPDQAQIDHFIAALVLAYGKRYMPALLPKDLTRMRQHQCFDNSLLQASQHYPKYKYVEGIGFVWGVGGTMVGILHAWLTDGKNAYDPTWYAECKGKEVILPAFYLGVELDIPSCAAYVSATGNQGVLANREQQPKLFNQVMKASGLL